MGPFMIMDKSTAQGLNLECYKYLGRYYIHLITPILFRELTSGLAKEDDDLSDAELKNQVSRLSDKKGFNSSAVSP